MPATYVLRLDVTRSTSFRFTTEARLGAWLRSHPRRGGLHREQRSLRNDDIVIHFGTTGKRTSPNVSLTSPPFWRKPTSLEQRRGKHLSVRTVTVGSDEVFDCSFEEKLRLKYTCVGHLLKEMQDYKSNLPRLCWRSKAQKGKIMCNDLYNDAIHVCRNTQ